MCNMSTTARKFRVPCLTVVKNVISLPVEHKRACAKCQLRQQGPWTLSYSRQESYQIPLLSIRERHVNNGNKFLGPCLKVVKNLISPPHPPPAEQKRACATCQQRQISHIPKTTILPRAAYQPHATNNLRLERVVRARFVCINDHEQGPNILKLR